MTVVLRGVRLYGEGDPVDVLVDDGQIAEIGAGLTVPDTAEVIDGAGRVLLPGFVDLHTHLREPGREYAENIETGSAAAALGGYTAVFAMANTTPVADTAGAPFAGNVDSDTTPHTGSSPDSSPSSQPNAATDLTPPNDLRPLPFTASAFLTGVSTDFPAAHFALPPRLRVNPFRPSQLEPWIQETERRYGFAIRSDEVVDVW